MKNYLPCLMLILLGLAGCKKEKNGGFTPVKFTETEYSYLGDFDAQGRPNYLVASDVISNDLSSFVKTALPENGDIRTTHPQYLKNADLVVTAKSEVYITFLTEGSSYANSVGYYTYKSGNSPKRPEDIKGIKYIFPHAQMDKGGSLKPGDKVKLGSFEAGSSIGFVLLQNGWDATNKKVNDKVTHFCSNKELNPENYDELKPHTALFDYPSEKKLIIGFEDVNRTLEKCDHDFNDVVMYATVIPL